MAGATGWPRIRAALARPAVRGLLTAGVLAAAAWALDRALAEHSYRELAAQVRAVPTVRLALAAVLAALVYLTMTGYDALALRYVGRRLPFRRTAFVSFTSYALSGTIGVALLTGGSIRLGLYSAAGLEPAEIAGVIAFGAATLWLGLLALAGVVFVAWPVSLPAVLGLPVGTTLLPGIAALAVVAAYLAWSVRGRPLRVGAWTLRPVGWRLALGQLALSVVDWVLSVGVLAALLGAPAAVPLPRVAATYLAAQAAGLASHVPGGLGVFDSIVVLLLRPALAAPTVLGAVVLYRVLYHLVPALLALLLLAGDQVVARRHHVARAARFAGRWLGSVVPQLLATATFAVGLLLLVSGAIPGLAGRMAWLAGVLPLGLVEVSHFVASVAGTALVVVALGLQRRLSGAWALACGLLAVAAGASLLKGADWEEAVVALALLAVLYPSRRHFHRRSSLLDEPFTPGWLLSIGLAVALATWVGFFALRHVEYQQDLWWRFEFDQHAPRFLRATVGSVVTLLLFLLYRLTRPVRPRLRRPSAAELGTAEAIVQGSPAAEANLALLGDKALLFNEARTAFIMYGVHGRSWVALGDPVGPREAWLDLAWRFWELADQHGGRPVFYRVGPAALPLYLDLGLSCLKLGEEATVPLDAFSLEGADRRGLRYIHNRLRRQGATFELVPAGAAAPLLDELRAVSDQWLARKRQREKGFSLGTFDPAYVQRFPVGVVRHGGRIVAFATVWPSAGNTEVTVDLMRYVDDAPRGVMEFLFVELMLWGQRQGYHQFSLGMVPLAGLSARRLAPGWQRLASLVFRHGEAFYNFQGLREYKSRFDPQWTARYLAVPRGLSLPLVLADVTALIAGGLTRAIAR